MSLARRAALILAVVAVCIVSDQSTKHLADLILKNQDPVQFFGPTVRFLYAENTGAWGSLGESWPPPVKMTALIGLPVIVLAWMVAHLMRKPNVTHAEIYAYSLILGGGLGNIIDRLDHGYVVDFMYIGYGRLATNIFNVADVAVVSGILLLAWLGMKPYIDEYRSRRGSVA